LQDLAQKAAKKAEEYEHETFLVGVNVPPKIENLEDELRAKFNVKWGESIRNELSREIGKRIEAITEKTVDYRKPDILIVINPFTNSLALNVRPLFIAGRYRKLVRGIPQSRWVCTNCNGKGCPHCDWKGKMYSESVEELIGAPLLKMTVGTDTRFHAAGREDVDARVLGPGRPFIIEVKKPKKRTISLKRLEKKIAQTAEGKAEASDLKMSSKEEVRKIKAGENAEKVYRAVVEFEREVSDKDIALLENSLMNNPIRQLTPLRVLHRRADKMRERRILETKVKRLKPNMVEMLIRCQGGLYIKELITGDQGRTGPNVSTLIGINGKCIELDVMDVRV
jgi:tRNA pseudouridine synthase 10